MIAGLLGSTELRRVVAAYDDAGVSPSRDLAIALVSALKVEGDDDGAAAAYDEMVGSRGVPENRLLRKCLTREANSIKKERTKVFERYLNHGEPGVNAAWALLETLDERGLANTHSYNIMLKACANTVEQRSRVYNAMTAAGVTPDTVTFNSMLRLLMIEEHDPQGKLSSFRRRQAVKKIAPPAIVILFFPPHTNTGCVLVFDDLIDLLKEMNSAGVAPDQYTKTYIDLPRSKLRSMQCVQIKSLLRRGSYGHASALHLIDRAAHTGGFCEALALIALKAYHSAAEQKEHVLSPMEASECPVGAVVLNSAINQLMVEGDEDAVAAIFDRMRRDGIANSGTERAVYRDSSIIDDMRLDSFSNM